MSSRYSKWNYAVAVVAVGLGACSPPPPWSAPAPGTGFVTGPPVLLPPGALNQLTRDSLRSLGNRVTWEGCVWAARTSMTSTPPTVPTVIQICAADYAKTLGQGTTGGTGALTARLINLGSSRDKEWELTPRDTSYIISFPNVATAGRYAILEVSASSVPGDKVRVVKQAGVYRYCPHGGPPSTSSASFYTCEQKWRVHGPRAPSDVRGGPSAAAEESLFLFPSLDGPAWVSCNAGCCTTD